MKDEVEQACISHEAFTQGHAIGKTFMCGNALRWRKPNSSEIVALMEETHGKHAPVLQQVWVCLETGEFDWRDVPMVSNTELTGGVSRPVE